jgi:sugar lactone lactonase YvrE
MSETIACVLDAKATIGECPVWSAAEQALYWIDICAPSLNRLDPASGATRCWNLPQAIGAFALLPDGSALVALRGGLYLLDLRSGSLARRHGAPYDSRLARFNDGRCDRAGRFWVGSAGDSSAFDDAGLYRYDRRGLVREVGGGLGQANGLAFSPDNRILYHADTSARTIYAYDFDIGTGDIAARRVFARVANGKPDGAAVDRAGCYWSACHGAGRLARYRPDGTLEREIELPVSQPTMMAFGGSDLATLYVTSERSGLDEAQLAREPLAGGILAIALDIVGLPEPMFENFPC